jgi:CRP-like cAMP-binding protein
MPDNVEKTTHFLTSVPLFRALKDKQLRQIAARVRERPYKKDDVIVEQGKMGVGLFIVETGEVQVVRTRPDGTSFIVDTLGPTQFFGELSLLDEEPRSASVIATQETVCLALTQLDFIDTLHEDAEMAVVMLKELASRFRRALANL